MQQVLLKILVSIVTNLLTAAFLSRSVVLCLRYLASKTENSLDDAMVNELAKALDCNDLVIEG